MTTALPICGIAGLTSDGTMQRPAGAAEILSIHREEMTEEEILTATGSDAEFSASGMLRPMQMMESSLKVLASGDFWDNWVGDMSFLSGKTGDGTKEKPYQISTKEQLMGLSALASNGMAVEEGEGTYPGDYTGSYFELTRNIDLGGINWIPIGFFQNEADMAAGKVNPFQGHFDGRGKVISNFRIYEPSWNYAGLFGAVKDAEIKNLQVKPQNVITAKEYAGLLAGSAENCIINQVTVSGTLKTSGTAGGIAGEISRGTVIENCTADHVAVDAGTVKETFAGGIVGKAAESLVLDCEVNTGDTLSARIQGGGYAGGIVGYQNGTDIFNVHVMGTIGGSGSQAIGGVTGKYASGKMKVARFEGKIAGSGLGSAAHEGTFIGTHDTGFHFRYGTENGADIAYLFADSEAKIAAGICGSGISDDNRFFYDAHIGFWHGKDNFFTLVQGMNTRPEEERYFYEELEAGMLHVIDTEEAARNMTCSPDHFAPNSLGRPVRGYLVSVLQIDTAANVQNYYDVASLTARGGSSYSHDLDKSHRGAVAAGDTVVVMTAPRNTSEEKYQMDGVPTYMNALGERVSMAYETGGAYCFVMPEHDTEISAVYIKVAADVRVTPEEAVFKVVQERTGDRKNPSTVTEVRDGAGKLIARYINGKLEPGTKVQEVKIEAIVDEKNDVADGRVCWSVDDDDLILLKKNNDEDESGFTGLSASVELNLEADFFNSILEKAKKEQAEKNYMYPIPDTIYGNGNMGGVAVLTAKTRPAASFEGKPLTANCKIPVTFQIKDRTKVAAEGAVLDKTSVSFTVTRKLTGSRKDPQEMITVTPPENITAAFSPDYFDKKDIRWSVDDKNLILVEAGGYGSQDMDSDYKNARISAVRDTKWIQDIIAIDDAAYANNPYRKRLGTGNRKAVVTVTADDLVGNKQTASCEADIRFVTEDLTKIIPETVSIDKEKLEFSLAFEKAGDYLSETVRKTGFARQMLTAEILPKLSEEEMYQPFNKEIVWSSSDPAIRVEDGAVIPISDAEWIQEAMKKAPYHGEKNVTVTAAAAGNPKALAECEVKLVFDGKCMELDKKELEFNMTLTKTGSSSRPVTAWKGTEGQKVNVNVYPQEVKADDENTGRRISWETDSTILQIDEDGVILPVTDAEWILEAMKRYPYTAEKEAEIFVRADGMEEKIHAVIKFRMDDQTYTASGSISSSGGTGRLGGSKTSAAVSAGIPKNSAAGVWTKDEAGHWLFTGGEHAYINEWVYLYNPYAGEGQERLSWFAFDENGYMRIGWYQDLSNGGWYYLHDKTDGSLGHMYTGWHQISGKWYFFGRDGRMVTGWNWIDGKCYYMDLSDGYMYEAAVTPDGYHVNADGAWTVNGKVRTLGVTDSSK